MFEKGEYVIYGNSGVCRILEVGVPEIVRDMTDKLHYTLSPVYREETIYTPVDTVIFIRPVMDEETARKFISQIPYIEGDLDMTLSSKLLKEKYQQLMKSHDCEDLVVLIKFLKAKIEKAIRDKRKPNEIDQDYLKRAEGLLYGELSVVFGIPFEEVPERIGRALDRSFL